MARRRWVLLLVLSLAMAAQAQSQAAPDGARLAQVEKLFEVMDMKQLYGSLIDKMMASAQANDDQIFPPDTMTPAMRQERDRFVAKIYALLMANLSWAQLEPDMAKTYAAAYTNEQLDGLIAFYSSPLGQAVLAKTPGLVQQGSAIAQQHMSSVVPQIRQMMQDEILKSRKMAGATPPAASTK